MKRLLAAILLAVISTACSPNHPGPQPELYLKCTKQDEPMGPYKHVFTGESGWEMYNTTDKWQASAKYQQTPGEFCEVVSKNFRS